MTPSHIKKKGLYDNTFFLSQTNLHLRLKELNVNYTVYIIYCYTRERASAIKLLILGTENLEIASTLTSIGLTCPCPTICPVKLH